MIWGGGGWGGGGLEARGAGRRAAAAVSSGARPLLPRCGGSRSLQGPLPARGAPLARARRGRLQQLCAAPGARAAAAAAQPRPRRAAQPHLERAARGREERQRHVVARDDRQLRGGNGGAAHLGVRRRALRCPRAARRAPRAAAPAPRHCARAAAGRGASRWRARGVPPRLTDMYHSSGVCGGRGAGRGAEIARPGTGLDTRAGPLRAAGPHHGCCCAPQAASPAPGWRAAGVATRPGLAAWEEGGGSNGTRGRGLRRPRVATGPPPRNGGGLFCPVGPGCRSVVCGAGERRKGAPPIEPEVSRSTAASLWTTRAAQP
jgi:hypothetical protein